MKGGRQGRRTEEVAGRGKGRDKGQRQKGMEVTRHER